MGQWLPLTHTLRPGYYGSSHFFRNAFTLFSQWSNGFDTHGQYSFVKATEANTSDDIDPFEHIAVSPNVRAANVLSPETATGSACFAGFCSGQ